MAENQQPLIGTKNVIFLAVGASVGIIVGMLLYPLQVGCDGGLPSETRIFLAVAVLSLVIGVLFYLSYSDRKKRERREEGPPGKDNPALYCAIPTILIVLAITFFIVEILG